MAKKHSLFLLLGSNIPPRKAYLDKAMLLISKALGDVLQQSSVYESAPWGFEAPVAFLNQAIHVETTWEPMAILKKTQEIERQLGRLAKSNKTGYTSRTMDIDLLFFDEAVIRLPELVVPHAQIANRRFTLLPLSEIAPEKMHPVLRKSCGQLLDNCTDKNKVWKFKEKQAHAV